MDFNYMIDENLDVIIDYIFSRHISLHREKYKENRPNSLHEIMADNLDKVRSEVEDVMVMRDVVARLKESWKDA